MDGATIKNGILVALAAVGSYIANALGGWDAALAVLIAFMVIDYLTGMVVGGVFKNSPKTASGRLSSGECFKGLVKKGMIIILVFVAVMLDKVIGAAYVRTTVILFFIANEGLSIIENTALMGVPYPSFIKKLLEAMKDSNDDTGGGT